MDERIDEVIAKLNVDANGLAFTGYITNAHVIRKSVLEGDIWCHVHAKSSERFADGHRIQISWIVDIHASGESIWINTENGSRYGILSFAPLGWVYFSNLHRAYDQLDPVPIGAPSFDFHPLRHSQQPRGSGALGKVFERRSKREHLESKSKVGSPCRLRPETHLNYMKQMTEHAQESIKILKRNGVNIIKHDE